MDQVHVVLDVTQSVFIHSARLLIISSQVMYYLTFFSIQQAFSTY